MKQFLSLLLLAFSGFTNAQVGFTNNGNLQIYGGVSVTVASDFTNQASANFINNGSIYLKRNIINNQAAIDPGYGTVYLSGNVLQTVSGTQIFKTYNLVTNNAAGFILNNDLSVRGVHIYTSGMITTSAKPTYMIYEAGSLYWGNGDTRHVNGWVKKIGKTNFCFPVGNATYERSISINNLTDTSEFNVYYNRGVTPNRLSLYDPLVYVDSSEYWTLNKISGSAAQVTMNWNNNKVPFPNLIVADIRVASFIGIFWKSIGGSATGSALSTGTITSNSISSFNTNFTFGSIAFALPLKIINFTAGRMNDYNRINWTIGNELNVDKYELERSEDGIHFYTIDMQTAYNRNGTENYSYDDRKLMKGTIFYRLKVTEAGNKINYSHIVIITVNDNSKSFYVITNPVDASIDIYADAAVKGLYNYTLVTTSGQLMQTGKLNITNTGVYSIHLNTVFAKGAYILLVQNEINRLQKTIIKK